MKLPTKKSPKPSTYLFLLCTIHGKIVTKKGISMSLLLNLQCTITLFKITISVIEIKNFKKMNLGGKSREKVCFEFSWI